MRGFVRRQWPMIAADLLAEYMLTAVQGVFSVDTPAVVPPDTVEFCSGWGNDNGALAGGSCGDHVHSVGNPIPTPTFVGWQHLGSDYHWYNNTITVIRDDGDPFTREYTRDWVGHWVRPDSFGVPDDIVAPSHADVPFVPDALVEQPIDPMMWPIGAPQPRPLRLPYKFLPRRGFNPNRSPTEQSHRGNTLPRVEPGLPPELVLPRLPQPLSRPRGRQGLSVRQSTGARMRPPRGTKEKKVVMTAGGVAMTIVGHATEFMDWTNALWWALPDKLRKRSFREHRGYVSPLDKAQDLWRWWRYVDAVDAIWNVSVMTLQDRAIGEISRRTSRNFREAQAGTGPTPAHGIFLGPAL